MKMQHETRGGLASERASAPGVGIFLICINTYFLNNDATQETTACKITAIEASRNVRRQQPAPSLFARGRGTCGRVGAPPASTPLIKCNTNRQVQRHRDALCRANAESRQACDHSRQQNFLANAVSSGTDANTPLQASPPPPTTQRYGASTPTTQRSTSTSTSRHSHQRDA
jgi:hypothetical protein